MRALVALALAIAGCYRPDIGSCFLVCGANNTCPDGLVCNGQGLCAGAVDDLCADPPGNDAATTDSPIGTPTTITVDVVAPDGSPMQGVQVVFSSPEGAPLAEMLTANDGRVVAMEIPTGSAVTIIRVAAGTHEATTHTDLWEDAHIVSRFRASQGTRTLNVSWSDAPVGGLTYFPFHTCFSGSFNTTNLTWTAPVSANCDRVDIVVIARDSSNFNRYVTSVADVPVSDVTNVTIPAGTWAIVQGGTDGHDLEFENLPVGMHSLQLSGYQTPDLAYTTKFTEANIGLTGEVGLVRYPTAIPAVLAVNMTFMPVAEYYQQLYVERLPQTVTIHTIDMATRKFPWMNDATLDPVAKTVTVPVLSPAASYAQPSIIYTKLGFSRAGVSQAWHIISPGSRYTSNATTGSLTLPEIPGDNAFEPDVDADSPTEELILLAVPPAATNAVRERLESRESTLPLFGIPGVSYILRATAF